MAFLSFLNKREVQPQQQKAVPDVSVKIRPNTVTVANGLAAMSLPAYLHSLELRANAFASCVPQMQTYRSQLKCWQVPEKYATEFKHLNYLLSVRPNSRMNASEMHKIVSVISDNTGCGGYYLRKQNGMYGDIVEIIPVKACWDSLRNTYTIDSDMFNLHLDGVSATELIVIRNTVAPKGFPTLLARTLTFAATAEQFASDTMAKGGTFKGIIKQEGSASGLQGLDGFNDTEMEDVTKHLREQLANGADLVYDSSASQLIQLGQSFQDLQVSVQRSQQTEEIARALNIPLPLMYCSTNAVYKSIDDAWHTFMALGVEPRLQQHEQEWNSKYLSEDDFGTTRFRCLRNLCLDSDKSKAETTAIYVNAGIMTRNESRWQLGLPSVEGGDILIGGKTEEPSSARERDEKGRFTKKGGTK